jgi:hypothetical protein
MDFDDSSSNFSLPPADLNTACFPSQDPLYYPKWSAFQGMSRSVDVISVQDFANSIDFLFDNLSCSGIKSHISTVMSIQV